MIDLIMTLCSLSFVYSLVPQIIKVNREGRIELAWQTLIISPIGLTIMTVCFYILDQKFTCFTNFACAICWYYLLFAKIIYKKH